MIKPIPAGPEEIVFSGKIIEIVHQKMNIGGKEIVFERARRAPGTRLVILSKDKASILITKEHRHEIDTDDYRLPGGKVFDKLKDFKQALGDGVNIGEIAKAAAQKELLEETGLISNNLTLLNLSHAGATIEWDLYYFLVEDFTESNKGQQLENGESISVNWIPNNEVLNLCLNGDIKEDRSVAALFRYLS